MVRFAVFFFGTVMGIARCMAVNINLAVFKFAHTGVMK